MRMKCQKRPSVGWVGSGAIPGRWGTHNDAYRHRHLPSGQVSECYCCALLCSLGRRCPAFLSYSLSTMSILSKSLTSIHRTYCVGTRSQVSGPRRAIQTTPKEFKVTLDGGTLYIERGIAEALGWKSVLAAEGVSLRLSGWAPSYFAITKKYTDAGSSARCSGQG